MNGQWKDILIKKISSACFVPASTGNAVHKNRPVHGLVFNEVGADKTYYFDDGTVLNTKGLEIFYLPKGSSYRAVLCKNAYGACYAINFETENELSQKPFTMSLRDAEKIHKAFKNAVNSWEHREDLAALNVTRQLYNAIF